MTEAKSTVTIGAAETVGTFNIRENGFFEQFAVTMNNTTNAVTVTLAILDKSGNTLYSLAAIAARNTTVLTTVAGGARIPVDYGYTCQITLSGVPGASTGIVTANMFVQNI